MTGVIVILAVLFGAIAIWAGVNMMKDKKPAPPRAVRRPQVPDDPWGM